MLGKTTVVGTTDKDALPLRATSLTAALLGNLPPGNFELRLTLL